MEKAPYTRREAEETDEVKALDAMLIGYDAQGFVAQIGSRYLLQFVIMESLAISFPFLHP
jgi:hypothetical protein